MEIDFSKVCPICGSTSIELFQPHIAPDDPGLYSARDFDASVHCRARACGFGALESHFRALQELRARESNLRHVFETLPPTESGISYGEWCDVLDDLHAADAYRAACLAALKKEEERDGS
jgi:hypothetical protein